MLYCKKRSCSLQRLVIFAGASVKAAQQGESGFHNAFGGIGGHPQNLEYLMQSFRTLCCKGLQVYSLSC